MILSDFKHGFKRTTHFIIITLAKNDQYHIPSFKSKLGQSSLIFSIAAIWNYIQKVGITKETSESPFSKRLKRCVYLVNFAMVITFLGDISFPSFLIHFQRCRKIFAVYSCNSCILPEFCNIICIPAKKPINPHGFPAPLVPIYWNTHVVLKSKSSICWICSMFADDMFGVYYVICTESLSVLGRAGANGNAQWHPEFLFRYWILFMYFCTSETILCVCKPEIV